MVLETVIFYSFLTYFTRRHSSSMKFNFCSRVIKSKSKSLKSQESSAISIANLSDKEKSLD